MHGAFAVSAGSDETLDRHDSQLGTTCPNKPEKVLRFGKFGPVDQNQPCNMFNVPAEIFDSQRLFFSGAIPKEPIHADRCAAANTNN